VAVADSGTAGENETKSFDVLANDTDVDAGDTKTLSSLGTVTVTSANGHVHGIHASGAFSIVGNQLMFTPGALFDHLDFNDTATVVVNYTMEDSQLVQSSSMLTLTVNGANDAPVAVDDSADASDGSASGNVLTDLVTGDTDVDTGDSLIVTTVDGSPVDGNDVNGGFGFVTFFDDGLGGWNYSLFDPILKLPKPNPSDFEVFHYTIDDGHGGTDTADLVITFENIELFFLTSAVNEPVIDTSSTIVNDPNAGGGAGGNGTGNGGNNAPVAVADNASAIDSGNTNVDAQGNVLGNDTGDGLFVTAVGHANESPLAPGDDVYGTFGRVAFNDSGDGNWGYFLYDSPDAPKPGAGDVDVFDYTIMDSQGAVASSTLTIDFIL